MPVIELITTIRAPQPRVFDLARSIDLHRDSTAHTGEQAVGGVTSGLIGLDQEVTWRAKHFGVWQRLTSRITAFEPPVYFRDSMVRGAFRRFDHDHHFKAADGATIMRDVFDFEAPLGWLGRLADALVLKNYLRRLLTTRNRIIQQTAESQAWQKYLVRPG
jgi:ligand-binding SRPBCC domain-containing protein